MESKLKMDTLTIRKNSLNLLKIDFKNIQFIQILFTYKYILL